MTCPKKSASRLSTQSKHFIDTIKMIAYRAETAMAQTLREKMARYDDARSLLRAVYRSEIDLLPNAKNKTLTVRLHPLANQSSDDAVRHLCAEPQPYRATLSRHRAAPRLRIGLIA